MPRENWGSILRCCPSPCLVGRTKQVLRGQAALKRSYMAITQGSPPSKVQVQHPSHPISLADDMPHGSRALHCPSGQRLLQGGVSGCSGPALLSSYLHPRPPAHCVSPGGWLLLGEVLPVSRTAALCLLPTPCQEVD